MSAVPTKKNAPASGQPDGAKEQSQESIPATIELTRNPRLDAALAYAKRGWPVVALHTPIETGTKPVCSCNKCFKCTHIGKHPRVDLRSLAHGAHSATTNEGVLRQWWKDWPDANVGIATGEVSGLIVVDIDPRNGGDDTFATLEVELGPIGSTVEALTGGGGRHLLFKHTGVALTGKPGPGVELLSTGSLIVAEPSLHASGKRYAWELSASPESMEVANLPEAWVKRFSILMKDGERGEYRDSREDREDRVLIPDSTPPTFVVPALPAIPADPAFPVPPGPEWTEHRVIEVTVPRGRGQHDTGTMDLARGIRVNLGISELEQARPIFDKWYDRARPHLANQDYDEAWFKFRRAFGRARIPLEAGDFATAAFRAARTKPFPKAANQFRGDNMRLLAAMCREMQDMVGGPFKLSCHQIAGLFNVKAARAWEWLRGLEDSLVIRCLDRGRAGRPGTGAATFEYIGDTTCPGMTR